MSLRPLKLPTDLPLIGELANASFQYPGNAHWSVQREDMQATVEMLANLKRMWPLVGIIQLVSPALRDILRGYVWEEAHQAAGVVLMQRRGTTNS